MKVTRTLHHSVNVEGILEATVAFYADLMELPSDVRPTIPGIGGHWFTTGNAQLHLVDEVHLESENAEQQIPIRAAGLEGGLRHWASPRR